MYKPSEDFIMDGDVLLNRSHCGVNLNGSFFINAGISEIFDVV
jgi:hypothetical protein